jgi:photosystem II stability/assembly factor-like uncharacterized protein
MESCRSFNRVFLVLATLQAGCTFYTSCPTTGAPAAVGGAGNGNGGNDGQSGSGAGPNGTWVNVTYNLANMPSECGNVANMSAKPDQDMLIVGIAAQGLFALEDGGNTWRQLGTGAGSDTITNRMGSIVYDPDNAKRFWESGIWHPDGVFITSDNGETFTQLGDVHHNDVLSVDFSDPKRKTLLAGGHEQAQTVYKSTDGGDTWSNVGETIDGGGSCDIPHILDADTYLVGCYGAGPGVYRSTNAGKTWTMVTDLGGGSEPLIAVDGSIYWASVDFFDGKQWSGLAHSTDQGATWTRMGTAGQISIYPPVELPDGKIAALGSQYVMISDDQGVTWSQATTKLPFGDPRGMVYSVQQKAFFVFRFTCNVGADDVPTDAIMRYDFDPDAQP